MKTPSICRWVLSAVASLALVGCGGGSGGYDDGGDDGMQQPPPPTVGKAAFVPFIKAQFATTSDEAEATEINDREFLFDEDETAYVDML